MSLLLLLNQPSAPTPATGLSLSGPSTAVVGTASSTYTVALLPGGGTSSGVVVTLHAPVAGTWSPPTVTLSTGSPSATLTFTPSAAGSGNVTATNNGGLTNPTALALTVTGGTESVSVTQAYRLIGTGSNWSGSPFSLVGGSPAVILSQFCVSTTEAYVVISGNGNSGPYLLSDGVLTNILLPTITVGGTIGSLVIVTTGPGGLA